METPLTTPYKQSPTPITADIYLPSPPSTPSSCPVRQLPHIPCIITQTDTQTTVLNIHGGAFMLGDSRMISIPQVTDCLSRGWIVVVPTHRLCPQVDIRDRPLCDVRNCLEWVYDGDGLEGFLQSTPGLEGYRGDRERVMAFGTSSGGMLALGLVSLSTKRVS